MPLRIQRTEFPDVIEVVCGGNTKIYRAIGSQDHNEERDSLLSYMESWSEDHYCAQWLHDLEYAMASAGEPTFRVMVERCGGWWTWADAERDEHGHFGPWRKWVDGTWDELRVKASRT